VCYQGLHGRDADGIGATLWTQSQIRRNLLECTVSVAEASRPSTEHPAAPTMDMKLEVVVLPVSDVDRAKQFYLNLGWRLDADFNGEAEFRVVQVTPPGSPCAVIFGSQITTAARGSTDGLMLVVTDIEAARADLLDRGVEVSDTFHDAGGVFHHAGTDARIPGVEPHRQSYGSFISFRDPDGNGWFVQELTSRLPGR
jgi:catechol 2,3-dioxygenase-like lactoylglutathione lyase family enzyme